MILGLLFVPAFGLGALGVVWVLFGLLAGAVGGFGFGFMFGIGLVSGPTGWLWLTEVVLALRGRGRVRLVQLLEDALERQVLRQAGAVYQFRHAELQDHLAARYRQEQGLA